MRRGIAHKPACAEPVIMPRLFPMAEPEVIISRDPDELARRAAAQWVALAATAIQSRGRFTVALSGG